MKKYKVEHDPALQPGDSEVRNYPYMTHLVWLAGSKLTDYPSLLKAFNAYKKEIKNPGLAQEDTFYYWSKSAGNWKSRLRILISIQATEGFAVFLRDNYPVSSVHPKKDFQQVQI